MIVSVHSTLHNSLYGIDAPRLAREAVADPVDAAAPSVSEASTPAAEGPPVAAPAFEAVVGGFRVGEVIGRKRSGVTTHALDLEGGELVAIHWIWRELIDAPIGRRLIEEAELAGAIGGDAVAAPRAIVREDGFVGLVRAYVPGLSVRERLTGARARLSVRETVALARRVARGLAAFHDLGLVHGDVRPETVVLRGASGRPARAVLTAFGCSVDGSEPAAVRGSGDAPPYAAPELSGAPPGAALDARADVHGFGVLLYEALTGRPPLGDDAPRARALRPEVPAWLDALIEACRAQDPAARPADAEALLERLDDAPPVPARSSGITDLAAAAVALALSVPLAAGGFLFIVSVVLGLVDALA